MKRLFRISKFIVLAFFIGLSFVFIFPFKNSAGFNQAFGLYLLPDQRSVNEEITLTVMREQCGKCHQSSLPTGVPKALEIFDLDKKPWYENVQDHHLESIAKRLRGKAEISEENKKAIGDFITGLRKKE